MLGVSSLRLGGLLFASCLAAVAPAGSRGAGTPGERGPTAPGSAAPSAAACTEVHLADVDRAVERYTELVASRGTENVEARAQAAALGGHMSLLRRFPEAREWYERALRGAGARPSTAQEAAAFQGLGWVLGRTPDHEQGVPYLSLAADAWRNLLGPDSPCEGITRERLANTLSTCGRFRDALPEYRTAMRILGGALGRDSAPCLRASHGYANALTYLGRPEEALPYYREVSEARHRMPASDDPALAWICHDYAFALYSLGRLLEAEPLYREAVRIRKGRFPDLYRGSASNLASCLAERGDLLGAQRVLEGILDSLDRDEHPDALARANVLQSMADLRLRTLDYDAAEDLCESVIRILGEDAEDHPFLEGLSLWGLAQVAYHNRDLARAETLQRRVLEIREASFGSESVYVDDAKEDLAQTLADQGRLRDADRLFRESLSDLALRGDRARYAYGKAAQDYSLMLLDQGSLSPAAAWIDTALTAFADILPPGHLKRIRAYETASRIHFAAREYTRAWDEALIAEREGERLFRMNLQGLAETSALLYKEEAPRGLPVLLSLLERTNPPDAAKVQAAWESLIASRNAVSLELGRRRRTAAGPGAQALRDSVDQERQELANLYVQGPSPATGRSYPNTLASLERHVERLEERLALRMPPADNPPPPGLAVLRKALKEDAALVAFVRYRDAFVDTSREAYGAFVLRSRASPRFVPLCAADSLARLVDRVREHMRGAPALLRLDPEEAETAWRRLGTELRRAIWDPLEGALAGASEVYLVPDGDVWRISLPSLPTGTDGYLVESGPAIRLLGSERDLSAAPRRPGGSGILVVGGVDYDRCGDDSASAVTRAFSLPPFRELPESRMEAQSVAALWKRSRPREPVVELLGDRATEGAFRRDAPRAAVLHLATHGYLPRTSGEMTVDEARLAGIALAGANHGGCHQGGDGILTASELSTLGLEGVQLVFLSSCGSGLGTLVPREGIMGLERSLRVAGCRSMVLSLWGLPDRATRVWVERFYAHYAASDSGASAALRKTCTETLALRRSLGRSTHPFYWGGFAVID